MGDLYDGLFVNTVLPLVLVGDKCPEVKMQLTNGEQDCQSVCFCMWSSADLNWSFKKLDCSTIFQPNEAQQDDDDVSKEEDNFDNDDENDDEARQIAKITA